MLRNGYAAYYDSFGIRPEDVGQGRGEILSQAALGLLVLVGRAATDQTIRWILAGGGVILFVLVCLSPLLIDALGFRRAVSLGFSAAGLILSCDSLCGPALLEQAPERSGTSWRPSRGERRSRRAHSP
jgi:hypothetical protein